MNSRLRDFLDLLAIGVLDKEIYLRVYMLPPDVTNTMPHSMRKQLNVIYMQRYKRFCINRQMVDFNPTFFDKTYVFSAANLVCTVKSLKYILRDVTTSPPSPMNNRRGSA